MPNATLFKPKAELPQWKMVYDELQMLNVGETIEYEALAAAVGFDVRSNRSPIYKAQRVLETEQHRTIANVLGVGYRVVEALEHETLARKHHKRSKKQLSKATARIRSADRSKLSAEDRKRFDAIELNLSRQSEMIRRLDNRVQQVESAVKESRAQQAELRAQQDEHRSAVEDRLARLEQELTARREAASGR